MPNNYQNRTTWSYARSYEYIQKIYTCEPPLFFRRLFTYEFVRYRNYLVILVIIERRWVLLLQFQSLLVIENNGKFAHKRTIAKHCVLFFISCYIYRPENYYSVFSISMIKFWTTWAIHVFNSYLGYLARGRSRRSNILSVVQGYCSFKQKLVLNYYS